MKTYIAYYRQSTMKQEISGLGVEAQKEIVHNYVKQSTIIKEFIETESGKKTDRPKLQEALSLCRKTGSTLIVAKLDRLSRNVAFTSKLLESDVEIVFCDFLQANRLILHIISSIAEYEAGLISTRTKQSLEAKKARGVKLGKSENLMNNHKQAIANSNRTNKDKAKSNPNNMRAVALLRSMVNEGKTPAEMVELLNEQGFTTSRGCKFQIVQVQRLIKRYQLDKSTAQQF
ncbi:MAG: recombinase family protein [Bacteroides sp.]|nr:recombinase family protein [Bacteroides sp.]